MRHVNHHLRREFITIGMAVMKMSIMAVIFINQYQPKSFKWISMTIIIGQAWSLDRPPFLIFWSSFEFHDKIVLVCSLSFIFFQFHDNIISTFSLSFFKFHDKIVCSLSFLIFFWIPWQQNLFSFFYFSSSDMAYLRWFCKSSLKRHNI
jgi:hypothetical protein